MAVTTSTARTRRTGGTLRGGGTVRPVARDDAEILELDGREVRLSSPGKVLFAERGETKRDLVEYYRSVGEPRLRTMGGRPVRMQRCPKGGGGPSCSKRLVPQTPAELLQTATLLAANGPPSRARVIS